MVFTVYVCDNFEFSDSGVLTIYGNYAEFSTNDRDMVLDFIGRNTYDAAVCPAIFQDAKGRVPKRIIFK